MDVGGSLVPQCHLNNAPQYPHRLCCDSSLLDWVSKNLSAKSDLVIMLNNKMDFNYCAIWEDFCNSGHIYLYTIPEDAFGWPMKHIGWKIADE